MPLEQTLQQRENAIRDSGTTPVPSPISVATLTTPQQPIKVTPPPVVPPPTLPAPTIEAPKAPVAPEATNSFTSELDSLVAQYGKKATDTKATVEAAALPYEQELNKVNVQLAQQYAKSIANQEAAAKSGETLGFASREQQNIARTDAIERLTLEARKAGLQGDIALAEKHAQAAVDAKYGQMEADIQAKKSNIYANYDTFNDKEKARARAVLLKLDKDDAFVGEQKANETAIFKIANTFLTNTGDTKAAEKIFNAKTPEEALLAAGAGLQDPKLKLELQKLRYDVEKSRLDVAAAISAANPLPVTGNITTDIASAISSNKVGATTKTTLSAIMGVQGALEQIAKDNPTGEIKGISPLNNLLDAKIPFTDTKIFNLPLGFRDASISEEGVTSRAYINGINLKVQQWASGAALTEAQTKQVEQMTPTTNDTDKKVKQKVNALYEFMNQQTRAALLSEGIDLPIPQNVDLWANNDTLEGIFQ